MISLRARSSIALAAVLTAPLWPSTAIARVHHTYATSYCLNGVMADGSTVRMRSAASDWLPLFGGLRRFVIRDTGPALSDGHLDIWHPSCSASVAWGARPVRFKIGWGKP